MKHIKYLSAFILTIGCISANAQQDAQFSLFPFQQLYWNPAATASDGLTRLQIHNRWQWAGYQATFDDGGAPTTLVVSAQVPLNFIKSAVGLHYVKDKLGASGNQEVQLSYSKRLKIGDNSLSIGVRAGFYSRFIDYSVLRPRDTGDPLIGTGRVSQTQPDLALGVYYDATSYYVGVSVNHLSQSKFQLGTNSATNPLKSNIYINAGYRWEPVYGLEIQPMVMIKSGIDFNLKTASVEGGVLATYNEHFFGGVTYRLQDAVIGMAGINLLADRSLRIALAGDLITGGKDAKSPVSYEAILSYSLPAPSIGGKKKIVRTPRFRY